MVGAPDIEMLPDVESWAVVHTHSRCEKVLAEFLSSMSVKYYLPMVKKRRVYGRHIRESMIPLFSGYVFYDSDGIGRREILKTNKVAKIIEPADKVKLKKELENIERAISSGVYLEKVNSFSRGDRVIVKSGPLQGVEGVFIRRKNQAKLIISISILGTAVETNIDESYVARL